MLESILPGVTPAHGIHPTLRDYVFDRLEVHLNGELTILSWTVATVFR